jgi:NTP pyrophosphatase (non-canonical NTP hydrolase)
MHVIHLERVRQDAKWGKHRNLTSFEWLTVLIEEAGECAKAILQRKPEELQFEIIQVAAVAVAWLEDILEFGVNDAAPSKNFKAG